jgi:hypothetical protein
MPFKGKMSVTFLALVSVCGCEAIMGLTDNTLPNPCTGVTSTCQGGETVQVTDLEKQSTEAAVDALPDLSGWGMAFKNKDDAHPNLWFATVLLPGTMDVYLQLTNNERSFSPDIAAGGGGFGIVWEEKTDPPDTPETDFGVSFAFINPLDLAEPVKVNQMIVDPDDPAGFAKFPSIAWNGSDFAVAWQDSRNPAPEISSEIWFARVDASGAFVVPEKKISTLPGESKNPDIAWSGSQYGVVVLNNSTGRDSVYLAILDQDGNPLSAEERLIYGSSGKSNHPRIAVDPSGYALTWADNSPGKMEIFFTRTGWDGAPYSAVPRQVTQCAENAAMPDILFTPGQQGQPLYSICWEDDRSNITNIYATTLDQDGNKLSFELQVTNAMDGSMKCKMALATGNLVLFWATGNFSNREIYNKTFTCSP